MDDNNDQESIVIGSGLSAIACAHALIKRGVKVRILDVGKELESTRLKVVTRMRDTEPTEWMREDIDSLKDPVKSSSTGLVKKLVYGSDFVYSTSSDFPNIAGEECITNYSLAKGGLSNAWGASVLPYREKDMEGWPITISDLEPHYRDVLSFLPLVGCRDDVANIFPLYTDLQNPLDSSSQARTIFQKYNTHKGKLNSLGIYCGHPRLAYHSISSGSKRDCAYCNLCVYGCPYELIYSSKSTLAKWEQQGKITYDKNILVERLEELPTHIIIHGQHLLKKQQISFKSKRVFLAAGVFPTAAIVLNSLKECTHQITLLDSQMFLIPYISFKTHKEATNEKAFTLSQFFMDIFDDGNMTDDFCYHLQGYTYTDAFSKGLEHLIPKRLLKTKFFKEHIFGRITILQGFLPSQYSGSLEIQLEKVDAAPGNIKLRIKGRPNPKSRIIGRKIVNKLMKASPLLGSVPMAPFVSYGQCGQSYHTGGSFPMKTSPGEFECDIMGRLRNHKRLHIVDGSIIPSLAGSPFAFTVMANAHRIASEIPLD